MPGLAHIPIDFVVLHLERLTASVWSVLICFEVILFHAPVALDIGLGLLLCVAGLPANAHACAGVKPADDPYQCYHSRVYQFYHYIPSVTAQRTQAASRKPSFCCSPSSRFFISGLDSISRGFQ